MKNMIALLLGLMMLTACGKQVGKDGNSPNPPPIGSPGNYNPPANVHTQNESWTLSNPNDYYFDNNLNTYVYNQSTIGSSNYNGGLEIINIQNTSASPMLISKNGVQQCQFIYSGNNGQGHYVSFLYNNGVWSAIACKFSVQRGDIIAISFSNSAAVGGIMVDVTEYIEN
jgi:hypothetical protein